MAIRIIDDAKLQNIAVAIQGKDNGGTMTVDQMPTRIENIPTEPVFDMTVTSKQIKMIIELTPADIDPLECGIYFFQSVANDVTIDWGDGTTEQSGDDIVTADYPDVIHTRYLHTYSDYGKKMITLTAHEGSLRLPTNRYVGGSYLIDSGIDLGNTPNIGYYSSLYRTRLKEVAVGDDIELMNYTFYQYPCLEKINRIVKSASEPIIPLYFQTGIKNLVIPEGVTTIKTSNFICGGVGINGYFASVKFPSTLTEIKSNAFPNQYGVKTYDFTQIRLNANNELPFTVQSNSLTVNPYLTQLVFATQEIAEVAKQTTNLSQYGNYITYEGAV